MSSYTFPTVKIYRIDDEDLIFALIDEIPEMEEMGFFWKTAENEVTFVLPTNEAKYERLIQTLASIGFEPAY